ncbi:MAG: glycosyltransferase family 39 protein [Chloroflexota bacterium]
MTTSRPSIYRKMPTPLRGERLALVLGRGITLLFGWVMLIAVYNLTGRCLPNGRFSPEQVTLFTALIPQVLYMSGVISNDIPVAALCTLSFWLLWRVVQKPTLTRGVAAGVAIGLALLTSAVLVASALVAFAWLWQRQQEKRVVWLVTANLPFSSALLIAGWWFGRAQVPLRNHLALPRDQAPWAFSETFQRDGLGQQWLDVFESFWASIGWSPTQFHDNVYWLLLGLVLLALVGLGKELWQG